MTISTSVSNEQLIRNFVVYSHTNLSMFKLCLTEKFQINNLIDEIKVSLRQKADTNQVCYI